MGFNGAAQWRAGLADQPGDYFDGVVLAQAAPGSFDECYQNHEWFTIFYYFCGSEFSTENVDFLLAADQFAATGDVAYAESTYRRFIPSDAEQNVNISAAVKSELDAIFDAPDYPGHCSPDVFVSARAEIYRLLQNDTFRRFQNSVMAAQNEVWNAQDWDAVGTRERSGGADQ